MENLKCGYSYGESLPKIFCKWWLKTRPCKNAVQINASQGIPACIEFYVPFWAWPFELVHRLVFGTAKFSKED